MQVWQAQQGDQQQQAREEIERMIAGRAKSDGALVREQKVAEQAQDELTAERKKSERLAQELAASKDCAWRLELQLQQRESSDWLEQRATTCIVYGCRVCLSCMLQCNTIPVPVLLTVPID